MNLNTIAEVKRPISTDDIPVWREGYAWLAGGTWLFSTPQIADPYPDRSETLRWPSLKASADGLEIAATCTIAELERFKAPAEWTAAPLLKLCCHALLMSFKIYNAATVGGNICMSLPAGAMISLATALEATYTLWPQGGKARKVPALDFVTGNHKNVMAPGELLRSIHIPRMRSPSASPFAGPLTHLAPPRSTTSSSTMPAGTRGARAPIAALRVTPSSAAIERSLSPRFTRWVPRRGIASTSSARLIFRRGRSASTCRACASRFIA
jgi:hypothetical protein